MEENIKTTNKKGVKDLTIGNPYLVILTFALPVFLSQLFQQLYNTADSYIVSKFLGTNSLGAVSSSGTLIFMLVSFFTGTAMGAGIVISRYFGANDEENVQKAIHTNIAFGLVSGIALTIVGVLLTPTLLVWMNTDPDILPESIEYFRYYFLGITATVMYNICRSIMNALGDSKRPLYYLIFSSILNVLLDLMFVGWFRWGVWSAAVATVISQFASVVLCFVYLLKKGHIYTVEIKKIKFHGDMLKEIIKYGLPAGVQNSVISLANVIVQSQINTFGKFATTAYGIQGKIEGFGFLPITSFTMALTTFISQNLGAKKYDRAKKGAKFGIFAGVVVAEVIGVIIYLLAPQMIGIFDKTPEVVYFGVKHMRTLTLFYCLLAYSHSIAAVCRGSGHSLTPMIIMLSVWCVFRVIYIAVVMLFAHEIAYIYWAYPLTWAISSVIYLIYYLCSNWLYGFEKKKKIEQ
ncbi:MAG: MATE family efflux transporter [Clostridiales bacterium]|nr:MATE family efflux transporter [Clostridiales bacterium]